MSFVQNGVCAVPPGSAPPGRLFPAPAQHDRQEGAGGRHPHLLSGAL